MHLIRVAFVDNQDQKYKRSGGPSMRMMRRPLENQHDFQRMIHMPLEKRSRYQRAMFRPIEKRSHPLKAMNKSLQKRNLVRVMYRPQENEWGRL